MVTDGWIRRAALGDPSPWHPLGLPWDDPDETRALPPGLTRGRDARPPLDEVLDLRRDRMATVRKLVDSLTDESLDSETEPVKDSGMARVAQLPFARAAAARVPRGMGALVLHGARPGRPDRPRRLTTGPLQQVLLWPAQRERPCRRGQA